MKYVRISNGCVMEIIPDYATPPETWYGSTFAAQCMEAPDEVQQGWVYDTVAKTFSAKAAEAPDEMPTEAEQMRADIDYLAAMAGVTL